MIIAFATGADELPAAFLFFEIEACGVGEEEDGDEHTHESEPRDDVKLHLGVDVIVQYASEEGAQFACRGGDTVSGGADRGGIDFCGDEEGDCVGAELVEE